MTPKQQQQIKQRIFQCYGASRRTQYFLGSIQMQRAISEGGHRVLLDQRLDMTEDIHGSIAEIHGALNALEC
ncbi:hypothetical protein [Acidithiobacillus ferridurans]|uniref:hypothetical protein n=1 Tax=Acidithiobacillus ferridurans TaxID=1232575 RepID=UPI001C067322|nr:hypothetical protein [Acidithiobacillus ferridurans]MBU2731490.1 hypothetical protein [Acidithiobacillus ferridurans]